MSVSDSPLSKYNPTQLEKDQEIKGEILFFKKRITNVEDDYAQQNIT